MGDHVFMIHADADAVAAQALRTVLEAGGLECRVAARNRWGWTLSGRGADSLAGASAAVVLLSPHSGDSHRLARETDVAMRVGVPIVLVEIGPARLPRGLASYVSADRWIDASVPPLEAAVEKIRAALCDVLGLRGSRARGAAGRGSAAPGSTLLKVCLAGGAAVGKKTLAALSLDSTFGDGYMATVGVKVCRKVVRWGDGEVRLMVWLLAAHEPGREAPMKYFRGCSGCVLVADGTRRSTLDAAMALRDRVTAEVGPLPWVCVVNKFDLAGAWEVDGAAIGGLRGRGVAVVKASAKSGEGAEQAFLALTAQVMSERSGTP